MSLLQLNSSEPWRLDSPANELLLNLPPDTTLSKWLETLNETQANGMRELLLGAYKLCCLSTLFGSFILLLILLFVPRQRHFILAIQATLSTWIVICGIVLRNVIHPTSRHLFHVLAIFVSNTVGFVVNIIWGKQYVTVTKVKDE
jgi:hypothetical protein